jgi:hypothetical protein
MEHHVIFLGAGASKNSGYPVGDALRLRLCSIDHFNSHLEEALSKGRSNVIDDLKRIYRSYFQEFQAEIDLFRYGGFATVDEFSKLASSKYPQQAQAMKQLMRLAFSFHNPEDKFYKSEYYGFLQRLFKDDLYSLRDNVTVISYNYDCYLDYLLMRALKHRKKLRQGNDAELDPLQTNVLTSGFDNPRDLEWEQTGGFKYLKLHGSILHPREDFHRTFGPSNIVDLPPMPKEWKGIGIPPIIFPWEFFDGAGNVILENDFVFVKQARDTAERQNGQYLFNLYRMIWQVARAEVLSATKISFVGLSFHRYMEDGLKHLFQNKREGIVEVVVANTMDAEQLCRRVSRILRRIAPNMEARGSWHDEVANRRNESGVQTYQAYGMTPRKDFTEFIEREME